MAPGRPFVLMPSNSSARCCYEHQRADIFSELISMTSITSSSQPARTPEVATSVKTAYLYPPPGARGHRDRV
jgi:hypothetical protein